MNLAAIHPIAGERIEAAEPPQMLYRALALNEFLSLDVKPRAQLLAPILPEKGLAMLYGPRGLGKTHVALSIAYAVASGGSALKWTAPAPRRVLFIDGEMPLATLQERIAGHVRAHPTGPSPDDFQILAADYFQDGLPNLGTVEGQRAIDHLLEGVALVVIDNLSTLASVGKDNDAESWTPVQSWLLSLRRRGLSVLLVHHAGKGGQQRGTSRREDVLDTVIALRRPEDYTAPDGARFEVHFEKARGLHGEEAKSFEAKLEVRDGAATWSIRDLEDSELKLILSMHAAGETVRDIGRELGMSKSRVQRLIDKAREQALAEAGVSA